MRKQASGYPRGRLLAGNRNTDGSFANQSTNANFWSSTESAANAWDRNLNAGQTGVNRYANNQAYGFSVRCLKDWAICQHTYATNFSFPSARVFSNLFTMADQSPSPATKDDVKGIMEYLARNDEGIRLVQNGLASLQKELASVQNGLASLQKELASLQKELASVQNGLASLQKELASLRKDMDQRFTETHHQFLIVAEDIKHDFQGAFHDKLEQHGDRILCLERHAGLVAR